MTNLHKVLVLEANLATESRNDHLRIEKSKSFKTFRHQLEVVRLIGVKVLKTLTDQGTFFSPEERTRNRWIQSNQRQREFVGHYNLNEIPYRFHEIPAGSILITDPEAYLSSIKINHGKIPFFKLVILKIKSFACSLFTGMRFTHAELSLGNGEAFDLDKKESFSLQGEGIIQRRSQTKSFYGVVMAPKKDEMLAAHYERCPESEVTSFEDLFKKIDAEARRIAPDLKLNVWDIFKTIFTKKRPANHDPRNDWNPKADRLSCAATMSSLFGKFGIDIGEEFGKISKNVTPRDFVVSRYFEPLYFIPKDRD